MGRRSSAGFVAIWAAGIFSAALGAQPPRTVWDGVYTVEQAKRGAVLFDERCAECHGPSGAGGGMAGALAGAAFSANYDGQTVGDLFDRNRTTMPPGREGQLLGPDNAAIIAFMLQFNDFPAGQTELPSQGMALKAIKYVAQKPVAAGPQQGDRPPGTHQDNTGGQEWIRRLERPERIPGLKIDEVVATLKLKPGDVVADIGSGTGAYTLPFAKAVAPTGKALAVDIWPELLGYIKQKAANENVTNLQTVLAALDDPRLPPNVVDVAFFHDVFHNTNDRQAYLRVLASQLKPSGRIVIVEQEFDDPIAKKWDKPEDRITREQVKGWMAAVGFALNAEFDIFKGASNPQGTGMPERWFVVYAR
ncbi:MAG: methyltransferase domain-containing protein [Vicinamibacterales bacterium]|jgi:predicted methyltransferase/mono/diheme cytochrome c family protein